MSYYYKLAESFIEAVRKIEPGRRPFSYYANVIARRTGYTVIEGVFSSPFSFFRLGIGKSVYALKTMMYVYRNWGEVKRNIFFDPIDLVRYLDRAVDRGERIPIVLWDDAGFWLNAQAGQTRIARAMRKFMNVIRLCTAHLVITAPSHTEVVRGVRNQLNLVHLITPYVFFENPRKQLSRAYTFFGYDHLNQFLRRSVGATLIYTFRVWFRYYPEYEELRKSISKIGARITIEEVEREINEISKKAEGARLEDVEA